jgi:hypothetical protein
MPDISYSDEALNVRNAFFGAKVIVYVEGDDDVLFWHEVFEQVADDHFEVESVGGVENLDEYIRKIAAGQLSAIAARDADFLPIIGVCSSNPPSARKDGASPIRPFQPPGGLMESFNASLQRGRQG